MLPSRRAARLELAAVVALVAGAAVVVFIVDPAASGWLPSCPFYGLTGLYCPLCGSTRALHQLLHGHVAAAFGCNALLVLGLPFFVYAFASYASRLSRGRPLPAPRVKAPMVYAVLGLIVAFAVVRNLPPFSALAP